MAKKNNMIDFTVDFTELAEFTGFLEGFGHSLNTRAGKAALVEATYNGMTQAFDDWMSVYARAHQARFTHVYEYAVRGDPYRHVGDAKYKLWTHQRLPGTDGSVIATFSFKPAINRIPTPYQRRNSNVGDDPIRRIEEADFQKLMEKTNHKRRYVFTWKAPMNEYGIARHVRPIDRQWLFLANRSFYSPMHGAAGPGWRFTSGYTVTQDPPGNSFGALTGAWTYFWRKGMTPHEFDNMVGDRAAKIYEDGLESGLNITKKSRKVTVDFTTQTDLKMAIEAGKAKARKAMGATNERLARINEEVEWKIFPDGGL